MSTLAPFISSLFLIASLAANEPYYHSVPVQEGEGSISLLRRYGLNDHQCNIEHFYSLNNIKSTDALLKDRKYKIPVLIYEYNGQSIRSSIGVDDWDKAIRIQKYNEALLQKGLRSTHFRSSKILWVPYHEMNCSEVTEAKSVTEDEILEPVESEAPKSISPNMLEQPLFGKTYERFPREDNSLNDQVFYIVSGHGGPDPGAIAHKVGGSYNLCEDEYAYDVSLRLMRQLMAKGAQVHMIIEDFNDGIRDESFLDCDKDETCGGKSIPLSQLDRLRQRAMKVNQLYRENKKKGFHKHKVICIHVDSRAEHRRQDVFFYYYGKSRSGKKLAQNLYDTFGDNYKKYQSNRGYSGTMSARPLYMLRKTDAPAVYIELANIRNGLDRERIIKKENREALAKWIAEGIAK